MDYRYTLGFIKQKDKILMVNREKQPWKGAWNGVGGKRMDLESPIDAIIREVYEETDILVTKEQVIDKGIVTWNTFHALGQGLHVYVIELDASYPYITPKPTPEGILDWKTIDWVCDVDNYGVAHNIPYFLPTVLTEQTRYRYHCTFDGNRLIDVTKEALD